MNPSTLKPLSSRSLLSFAAFIQRVVSSKTFLRLTLLWFGLQATYMALSTSFGIPPDEVYHFSLIKLLSESGWLPYINDQSGYYFLGEVQRTPFILYHYLLSLPMHLFNDYSGAYIILRFLNVAMAFWSIYLVMKLAEYMRLGVLVKNLSVFMLTNTLMFVFLSASISYDNLFIPLSLLAFYLLLKLAERLEIKNLLLLMLVIVSGTLVKINFLSIAFICMVVIIALQRQQLLGALTGFYEFCKSQKRLASLLIVPLLVLLAFSTQRFASNLVTYTDITPACNVIHTEKQCSQSGLYMRTQNLKKSHPPVPDLSPFEYTTTWLSMMKEKTFGIMAHKNAGDTLFIGLWAQILILLMPIALVRKIKLRDKKILILLALGGFYTLTLLFKNYSILQETGIIGLAVQGRYMFAILPLIYLIGNYYVLGLFRSNSLRSIYIVASVMFFASASLPSYIAITDDSWHTESTKSLNHTLHDSAVRAHKLIF